MSTTVLSNIRTRLRLLPATAKDAVSRLRVRAQGSRDIPLRFQVQAQPPTSKDGQARMRLRAIGSWNVVSRLRLFVPTSRDLTAARIRLKAVSSKNLRGRLRLLIQMMPGIGFRVRMVSTIARPNPSIPAAPSALSPQLFGSLGPALPLLPPVLPYQVNGIMLDCPVVCSAPASTGLLVVAGSVFTLVFQNMSATTNNTLITGLATMTFALVTGEMVTGPVLLAVQLVGATTTVTVTTQADILVNRWVVSSQFA